LRQQARRHPVLFDQAAAWDGLIALEAAPCRTLELAGTGKQVVDRPDFDGIRTAVAPDGQEIRLWGIVDDCVMGHVDGVLGPVQAFRSKGDDRRVF